MIQSIYGNNCQLSFSSCSSTSNTMGNVDDHQCRSIRTGWKVHQMTDLEPAPNGLLNFVRRNRKTTCRITCGTHL